MTIEKVPFFDLGKLIQSERGELHDALDTVIDSSFFVGGPVTQDFETEFANYIGVKHCVSVANGLDAIRIMLESFGVGPGDEVIVPAFTYYATWLGVMQAGAIPVPVDVEYRNALIDPLQIEQAITSRTKAILVVHLYGQGVNVAAIKDIANKHNLYLFEDAAQSHGAFTDIGVTGSVSDAAAFSFYPTKNLGALGDAGAITTNSDAAAKTITSRRSYGQGNSKYDHVDTGWNSRLDPLQAAFLKIHLQKLPEWNSKRFEIATKYAEALGRNSEFSIGWSNGNPSVWHHYVLKTNHRKELIGFLEDKGVSTDIHYPYSVNELAPMRQNLRPEHSEMNFVNSLRLSKEVVSLPIGPWMNHDQISKVAAALSTIPSNLFI